MNNAPLSKSDLKLLGALREPQKSGSQHRVLVSSCPRGRTEDASAPLSLSWRQKIAALSWPDIESGRVTCYRSLRGVHWCVDVHVASPVSNHIHRILDRTGSRTRFVDSDASFHGSDQLQNQSEPLLIRSSGIVHGPISSHPPSS